LPPARCCCIAARCYRPEPIDAGSSLERASTGAKGPGAHPTSIFVFDLLRPNPGAPVLVRVFGPVYSTAAAARALLAPRLVVAPDAPCWRVPVSS